jgi:hypothetical protein
MLPVVVGLLFRVIASIDILLRQCLVVSCSSKDLDYAQ